MNFYQAPIARTFLLTAKDATSTEAPLVAVGGVWPTAGKANGRAVTVFFETPGWPTASHKIEVRVQGNGAGNNGSFAAAPNVCLSDADEYLFLRGNSVFVNNATVASGTHVVYSATLDGIQPSATRASSSNNYWVRPGDTFTFTNPVQAATVGSNIGTAPSGSTAVVTSVRQKGGPDRLVIEFSVPISTADIGTGAARYRNDISTRNTWPLRDLVFFGGSTTPGVSSVNPVGLAFNRLTVQVSSSGNWSGALSGAVNLTYPSANPAGMYVPDPAASVPAAAGLVNPSNMAIMSAAALTSAGRTLTYDIMGNLPSVDRYSNAATFEHRPDFNQGSAPYRSISFSASAGTWAVEVLVHPLH
jgi:hypothetical protein